MQSERGRRSEKKERERILPHGVKKGLGRYSRQIITRYAIAAAKSRSFLK